MARVLAGNLADGRAAVSLPASQQRILDRIERKLRDSDPRLTALFSIFGRLTRDEDMPRAEEIRARLARFGAWAGRFIPHPSDRVKAIIFFPCALATVICALVIGASGPTVQRCASSVRAPASELIVEARQCRLTLVPYAPLFGH
jgi:hypothetical protein